MPFASKNIAHSKKESNNNKLQSADSTVKSDSHEYNAQQNVLWQQLAFGTASNSTSQDTREQSAASILVGRPGSQLEQEANSSIANPTPVSSAADTFDENRSETLREAVMNLDNAAPEGAQATRVTRELSAEAATINGKSYFAPGALQRHGFHIAEHEAIHAKQQANLSKDAIYIQAYDPPLTGTQPFPVMDIGGRPMVNIPTGAPAGAAAEAAIARLESLAANGATVPQISRAALTETAALPGGHAIRAQFYQRATAVVQRVAGTGWLAIPYAGPGGSVIFLGKPVGGVAGYGAIVASDGTIATGTFTNANVTFTNGQVQLNMSGWRVVTPQPPAVATNAVPGASAGAAAEAEAAAAQAGRRPPPTGGTGQGLTPSRGAGMARAIAMHVLIFIGIYLLQRWHQARQREQLEALWESNVSPPLTSRLTQLGTDAWNAMLTDPFSHRYARIEADVIYEGHPDIPGRPSAWNVTSARFVRATMVTQNAATSVNTIRESVSGPLFSEPRVSETQGTLTAATPFDTFQRTDRYITYEPLLSTDQHERVRLAVVAAVTQNRTLGSMIAAHGGGWSVSQLQSLSTAYLLAAAGNPSLTNEANQRSAEIQARAEVERRFGTSAYIAAIASIEAGLSARQSANQTHWSDDAERLNFVRAYAAVATGQQQEAAFLYIAELQAQMPQSDDQSLIDFLRAIEGSN